MMGTCTSGLLYWILYNWQPSRTLPASMTTTTSKPSAKDLAKAADKGVKVDKSVMKEQDQNDAVVVAVAPSTKSQTISTTTSSTHVEVIQTL